MPSSNPHPTDNRFGESVRSAGTVFVGVFRVVTRWRFSLIPEKQAEVSINFVLMAANLANFSRSSDLTQNFWWCFPVALVLVESVASHFQKINSGGWC